MNTNPSQSVGLHYTDAALPIHGEPSAAAHAAARSQASRAEAMQRSGERMILAGFVIAITGVVAYCVASFAAGMSADMGDILFKNTVPFARATLAVLGVGTLVWLAGSFTYLRGAMDADESPEEDGKSLPR